MGNVLACDCQTPFGEVTVTISLSAASILTLQRYCLIPGIIEFETYLRLAPNTKDAEQIR